MQTSSEMCNKLRDKNSSTVLIAQDFSMAVTFDSITTDWPFQYFGRNS